MTTPSPDYLHLSGTLQAETALEALTAIDVNPAEKKMLSRIINVYRDVRIDQPDGPDRFELVIGDETGASMKANIIAGLEILSTDADTPEKKIAAQALLEVMRP